MKEIKLNKVDPSKLFSVSEYAKKIGLSKGRVSQKVYSGEIRIVRYNGGYLIHE
jgi:hypothetical protein